MNEKTGVRILSLFDGISIAQLALKELNIKIDKYYSSEVDRRAMRVTQHHFPDTIQLGDVRQLDGYTLPDIDLLVFGSPCQNLSSLRKDRQGLDSEDSGLFFEALRLLREVQPRYFLMENVGSMSKHDKKVISDLLEVEPIAINSNMVSATNRNRLYWTDIPDVDFPDNRSILLKDIIESGYVDRTKSNAILTKTIPHTKSGLKRYLSRSIGQVVFNNKTFAEVSRAEKLKRIDSMDDVEVKKLFRLFTVSELEKCQTLPKGYVGNILRKTPSHHAIGNGFTLEVIKHILSKADFT